MGTSFWITGPTLTGSGGRAVDFGASLHPAADTTTATIRKARAHMLEIRMLAGVYCKLRRLRSQKMPCRECRGAGPIGFHLHIDAETRCPEGIREALRSRRGGLTPRESACYSGVGSLRWRNGVIGDIVASSVRLSSP